MNEKNEMRGSMNDYAGDRGGDIGLRISVLVWLFICYNSFLHFWVDFRK